MNTTDNKQQEAINAMNVSREAAELSAAAAKTAARDQIAVDKAKAADKKSQIADKVEHLKEMANDKVSGLGDKLEGFAASALDKGADMAKNLADKLRK